MYSIRRLMFPVFSALALVSSSFVQADLLSDVKSDLQPFIMRCNNPARAWIRILFHDAANGGCDGSIQFEQQRPENQALTVSLSAYRRIADKRQVSMADIIVLAAYMSIKVCGGPDIPFKFGRVDATGPNPPGMLPGAHISPKEIKSMFMGRLGLSIEETVAIIGGGHSAGRSRRADNPDDFSVQTGPLDSTPDVLDNAFFKEILANPSGAMIPADGDMVKDPELKAVIERFATKEDFMPYFVSAMQKMAARGQPNMK